MAVPGFQEFMWPLLELAGDSNQLAIRDAYDVLADRFELTEDDRAELLASGKQPAYQNRIGWARTYMCKAGLLESTGRGMFRITTHGREVLSTGAGEMSIRFLCTIPEFKEWHRRSNESGNGRATKGSSVAVEPQLLDTTPQEQIEAGYRTLRNELRDEIKTLVFGGHWLFFEQLVIDVLLAMGYGGSRAEAGRAFKRRSNDGGIDGIIDEDTLGLDRIYVQAKKWSESGTVGRPEIHKFVGALQGVRARKGIFMTTTTFSREAIEYTDSIDTRVVLIDGDKLADLMIDHNVGVTVAQTYEIKRVDTDFFAGE